MKKTPLSLGGPLHVFVEALLGATPEQSVARLPVDMDGETKALHLLAGQKLWEQFRSGDFELGLRLVTGVCQKMSLLQSIDIYGVEFNPATMKLVVEWDYRLVTPSSLMI